MDDKARAIFLNAQRYSESTWILNNTGKPQLLLPSLVNGALALELYFKTLYYCIKEKDFKEKTANGGERFSHDFFALFRCLDDKVRAVLESSFEEQLKQRNMSGVKALEKSGHLTASIPRDLPTNLKAWSSVFVKVRYIYETKGQEIPMMFFPEIERSVVRQIYLERPEWNS